MAPSQHGQPVEADASARAGAGAGADAGAGERVVISGMSGLYPNSAHVKDLADILYNKINPVTPENSRWEYNHPEVVNSMGKVPDLQYFDAQFFKVHYRLGNNMDAMGRKVLEQAYQAIYDAGMSPEHLSGKKVGVFIGTCFSESEKIFFYALTSATGFGIAGCSKTMFANRISYWLDVKGPSMAIDQGCNSSMAAVELAYKAIATGQCEAAIVGGTDISLHPHSLVHYGRLLKLNKEGKMKSFDENAEGIAKSEAINVLFLQKAKNALRVYAEIVHVKSEFTAHSLLECEDTRYSFCRSIENYTGFLKGFYKEAKVPAEAVEYVEACGSAVPEAEKVELMALENIFCNDRRDPLLIGSVMSNVGYGGAATGITAITKVLLGYQTGQLAANLHCATPRRDVAALRDGRMRVVRDHTRFGRSYTAVNGLSVTGTNAHVLLNGCYKPKNLSRYKSDIPQLVLVSGRQETAVQKVFNYLKSHPVDPEELALLNNIHITRISGNLGRGYTILDKNKNNETVSICEKIDYFDYVNRPLWFVYSGMGSQWAGMGTALMRIPVFAAAIQRCHRVLKPKGLDIAHIITTSDKTIFDNILHSFVGIAAVQIGLTDVLRAIGLVPDKIIGHSVGELGCAYADGCFTPEEMILAAYSRGLVSVQTPLIRGSMAAVGLGYQKIITMCPPEIEVACHNSSDSCTISGPSDAVKKFVTELESNGIFAKEVLCSNIAFHSRYIEDAGPKLLEYLKEVIKSPKVRSHRWLSTSVPFYKWKHENAKYSSAEYHTNNLLNPVLFEETCNFIPPNAVLLEVAPHGLLQAILNRSLPPTCKNISITRRGHADNAVFLLEAIGKLYIEGFNPNVQSLYPKIDFPVSTGTPMLSHLVEWAHHEKWDLPLYASALRKTAASAKFVISLHDDEHAYLLDHMIRGKVLYPFSAALVAVWDTLAMTVGAPRRRLAVRLRDVALHAQPALHDRRQLRLAVALHRGTGSFEVMDDINSKVASGFIYEESHDNLLIEEYETKDLEITANEIYNNFFLREVCYKTSFQSIHSVNSSLTKARIHWRDNWVTFIDGMIQLNTLRHSHESYSHPNFIRNLIINPEEHYKSNHKKMTATVLDIHNRTRCGGVLMENITFRDIPPSPANATKLRALKFIPHFGNQYDFETILQVYLQIVSENMANQDVNILGIYDTQNTLTKFHKIKEIMEGVSEVTTVFRYLQPNNIIEKPEEILSNVNLVLCYNLSTDNHMGQTLYRALQNNTFVINIQEDVCNVSNTACPPASYRVVCGHRCVDTAYVELARWQPTTTTSTSDSCVVTVLSQSDFATVSQKRESLLPHQILLILTTYPAVSGLKDIVKDFKQKPGSIVRLVMTNTEDCKGIDAKSLVNVDLVFKVFKNSEMGGEYYVPLQDDSYVKDKMLRSSLVGQMDSLHWIQAYPQQKTGVTVEVHYAGFNNLDVRRATGLIPVYNTSNQNPDCSGYGMDFSGITESGIRVMGLVCNGAISSHVQASPELLWPVPEHWSLEDAATVPLAYCLAYYCLTLHRGLYPGMDVLVHGGAGALGQAVISIALSNDCNVFTTVSDVRKKSFLLKLFPKLKAENIGNSRDSTFCDMVLNATQSKGVEMIICCVNGELKNASLKCLSSMGYIIDVGQIPHRETFDFGMYHLTKNRSYVPVNIFSILNEKGITTMKRLQRLVGEGVARGWVRPLSRVTYAPRAAPRALRLLAAAAQRGRVLLRTQDAHDICVQPQLQCSSDQCHIIISDHENVGKQLIDKMVSRGVRQIRLLVRQPLLPQDFVLKMRQWQGIGVQVSCELFSDARNDLKLFTESLKNLGAVEGIYIILTNKHTAGFESNTFIEKMDVMARTLFPKMKYFAVINAVNSAGEDICMTRSQNNFAGTMIKLPEIFEMNDDVCEMEGIRVSVRQAVDAVERALATAAPALALHAAPAAHRSLLQQIAAIAEIDLTRDIEATNTLFDLGMNPTKCNDVWVFLRDTHNICLKIEEIQELTVQRIKDIDETIIWTDFDNERGLNKIFSYVDTDELLATSEMVFLPTLINSDIMRDDEFDMTYTHLCIVPGVEGHHGRFRALCERLKLPALVLQPGLDHPHETVREMAHRYTKILLEKANLNKTFYLLGYESGTLVALEMAAILEDNDLTGVVYCIGNPDEMKTEIKKHLHDLNTKEKLQDAILRHIFNMMTKRGIEDLELALRGVTLWREKIDITVRALLGRVPHSAQYVRLLIEAAYGRIVAFLGHEVEVRTLRSRLVLLQPRSQRALAAHAASLQPHSQQHVVAHALRAPLAHAAHDLRCAAIINTHLTPDILEAFENKNLCESYLLNPDSFMTQST